MEARELGRGWSSGEGRGRIDQAENLGFSHICGPSEIQTHRGEISSD